MTVWAFVPARGGSKRVNRKNMQNVGGVPLLFRTVSCAHNSGEVDRVVVSTDDPGVAAYAEICDMARAPIEIHDRPEHLASDTAQIEDAIAHWMRRETIADDDVVCLLQCTAPFRRPETVRRCVEWVRSGRHAVCVAATRDAARVNFSGRIRGVYDAAQGKDIGHEVRWNAPSDFRPRSQDCRNVGTDRGTCWAFTARHFRSTGLRMAAITGVIFVSEVEAFDIDSPSQLEHARILAPHAERLIAMEET